jgi:hypothetical protein
MKKVLVFLMILAVAAGAFAQGTWWSSAYAQAGTSIDFNGDPTLTSIYKPIDDVAGGDFPSKAGASVGYSIGTDFGTLGAGIDFSWNGDVSFNANGQGNDDRYYFIAKGVVTAVNKLSAGPLWGYYRLLQGGPLEIYLEADVVDGSWGWWDWKWSSTNFDHSKGFTVMPFARFWSGTFGAEFKVEKLSFGIIIPDMFAETDAGYWGGGAPYYTDKLQNAFMKSVIGAKFEDWDLPFNVGLNFGLDNYAVYFGMGTTIADIVQLGLAFNGEQAGATYNTNAGLRADYSNDSFGFGVDVMAKVTPDFKLGLFPKFWYKVLPDNLYFGLNAGFMFGFGGGSDIDYEVDTRIAWNFNNSGAEAMPGTGMVLRYLIQSEVTNALYIVFRWNI